MKRTVDVLGIGMETDLVGLHVRFSDGLEFCCGHSVQESAETRYETTKKEQRVHSLLVQNREVKRIPSVSNEFLQVRLANCSNGVDISCNQNNSIF